MDLVEKCTFYAGHHKGLLLLDAILLHDAYLVLFCAFVFLKDEWCTGLTGLVPVYEG